MTLHDQVARLAHANPTLTDRLEPLLSRSREASERSAASKIDILDGTSQQQQELILFLERSYGMRSDTAWGGIHGVIVDFKTPDPNRARFDAAGLKKLMSYPTFRWLSLGKNPSVGM